MLCVTGIEALARRRARVGCAIDEHIAFDVGVCYLHFALTDKVAVPLVLSHLPMKLLLEFGEPVKTLMEHSLHSPLARVVMIALVQLLQHTDSVVVTRLSMMRLEARVRA